MLAQSSFKEGWKGVIAHLLGKLQDLVLESVRSSCPIARDGDGDAGLLEGRNPGQRSRSRMHQQTLRPPSQCRNSFRKTAVGPPHDSL